MKKTILFLSVAIMILGSAIPTSAHCKCLDGYWCKAHHKEYKGVVSKVTKVNNDYYIDIVIKSNEKHNDNIYCMALSKGEVADWKMEEKVKVKKGLRVYVELHNNFTKSIYDDVTTHIRKRG